MLLGMFKRVYNKLDQNKLVTLFIKFLPSKLLLLITYTNPILLMLNIFSLSLTIRGFIFFIIIIFVSLLFCIQSTDHLKEVII